MRRQRERYHFVKEVNLPQEVETGIMGSLGTDGARYHLKKTCMDRGLIWLVWR